MISESDVENIIHTKVNDIKVYQRAFTHKSVQDDSYENLEFMGDSVLGFVVTKFLYDKYSNEKEGFLTKARTKFVRGSTLAHISEQLGLFNWIRMDEKGLRNGWNRNPKILEDVLEAFIGAIYVDLGIMYAKEFILRLLTDFPIDLTDDNWKDAALRRVQIEFKTVPTYEVESFVGGIYTVHLLVNGAKIANGSGNSKKKAEQDAAFKAMEVLDLKE